MTHKGYCEVCKKLLKEDQKYWDINICRECYDEPCKHKGCGGSETIEDELDIRKIKAEEYLKPEEELPF